MAVGEVAQRAHKLVVVGEVVDAVVLDQRLSQLGPKLLVRRIPEPEDIGAGVPQPDDELEPVRREVRRQEDDVHRRAAG